MYQFPHLDMIVGEVFGRLRDRDAKALVCETDQGKIVVELYDQDGEITRADLYAVIAEATQEIYRVRLRGLKDLPIAVFKTSQKKYDAALAKGRDIRRHDEIRTAVGLELDRWRSQKLDSLAFRAERLAKDAA